MNSRAIKFEYDSDVEAAYLTLARGKIVESEEVEPGIIVGYSTGRRAFGIEFLRFAKRFAGQMKPGPPRSARSQPSRLAG